MAYLTLAVGLIVGGLLGYYFGKTERNQSPK